MASAASQSLLRAIRLGTTGIAARKSTITMFTKIIVRLIEVSPSFGHRMHRLVVTLPSYLRGLSSTA